MKPFAEMTAAEKQAYIAAQVRLMEMAGVGVVDLWDDCEKIFAIGKPPPISVFAHILNKLIITAYSAGLSDPELIEVLEANLSDAREGTPSGGG